MPDLDSYLADAFGVARPGDSIDGYLARNSGLTGDPNIDPNNLERALGDFIQDKPALQSVLDYMSQPASAIANVAQAGVQAFQGEGGDALDSLGNAAKNIGGLAAPLPFIERSEPDTRTHFKKVLTQAGVGDLGEFDVPMIGRVTGKGALGLGLDIATDPLRAIKPFGLTQRGTQAAARGALRPAQIASTAERAAGKLMRHSDLGAQTRAGQRALLAMNLPGKKGATAVIRGQKVMDAIGRGRMAFGASWPGRALSTTGRLAGIGRRSREAGLTTRAEVAGPISNLYRGFRDAVEERVIQSGGNFDDVKKVVGDLIEGKKKPLDVVPQLDGATDRALQVELQKFRRSINKKLSGRDQMSPHEVNLARDYLIENPELIGEPNGVFTAVMAARTNRVLRRILAAEKHLGVDIHALDDAGLNYYFRTVTPEAKAVLARHNLQNTLFSKIESFFDNASTRARKEAWRGKPISEINKWWEAQPYGKGIKLFETDPDIVVRNRLRQTAGHASTKGALTKSADLFAVAATPERLAADWIPMEKVFEKARLPQANIGEMAGKVIPPEIASELQNVVRVVRDPTTPSTILNVIDYSMSMMKTGSTSIFPQFHARNHISNVYANFLAGVVNPKRYKQSWDIQMDLRRIGKHGGDGKTWKLGEVGKERILTTRELAEEMRQHRVLGFGQLSAEELGKFSTAVTGENVALGAAKKPFRYGRQFGEGVENHAKIAHYVDKLGKGFTPDAAASSVKKYLFDYGDLTVFEKNVMKRVVPFYTFFRKNLPLQLESLLMQPGKVSGVAHVQRALQAGRDGGGPMDTAFIPEWTRRRLFGKREDGDSTTTLSGLGIGLEELAILDKPLTEFLAMLRPEIKGSLQMATDRDLFRDMPLSKADSAPGFFRHFGVGPPGKAFLDWLDFKAVDESKGRYRANPKILNWINSGMGGVSRGMNVIANLERTMAPGAKPQELPQNLLRLGVGFREDKLEVGEQQRRNMWAVVKLYEQHLEEQVAKGNVKKFEVYSVRRDTMGVEDPQAKKLKELMRELAKTRKAAIALGDDRAMKQQGAFRSGGR